MESIIIILLAVSLWLILTSKKPQDSSSKLIVNSDYLGKYEPNPIETTKVKKEHSTSKITSKLPPLKRKNGGFRKTRNSKIDDDLEYILFDRSIKISFYYSGNNGLKRHEIMITYIMGTEQGTPAYLCGNKIDNDSYELFDEYEDEKEEDIEIIPEFENLGKFLTFRIDRMMNIDYKGKIHKTPDLFISALASDYPSDNG